MPKNTSLAEFGYNFLGPILAKYIVETNKKVTLLSTQYDVKVFHLAREGYVLQKAFEIVNCNDIPSAYLNVSRTFLFRILSDVKESWPYSVKHSFKGTLRDFFYARFAFTQDQVDQFLPSEFASKPVVLPDDFDFVCKLLEKYSDKISKITSPIRHTYLNYLQKIGFTNSGIMPVVLDVGYSGTIQKLLAILASRNVHGIYMITTNSGRIKAGEAFADVDHVFKTDVKMGGGYLMLDRSMFLESLLTAPNGQFVDILQDANTQDFHFCYGKRTYTQENFADLETVLSGALSCVEHCVDNGISYTMNEIEELFSAYVTKRNMLPRATWPLFVLDDAISGEGNLEPLTFFGL